MERESRSCEEVDAVGSCGGEGLGHGAVLGSGSAEDEYYGFWRHGLIAESTKLQVEAREEL